MNFQPLSPRRSPISQCNSAVCLTQLYLLTSAAMYHCSQKKEPFKDNTSVLTCSLFVHIGLDIYASGQLGRDGQMRNGYISLFASGHPLLAQSQASLSRDGSAAILLQTGHQCVNEHHCSDFLTAFKADPICQLGPAKKFSQTFPPAGESSN